MRPKLSADDAKAYKVWLKRIAALYLALGAIMLLGISWNVARQGASVEAGSSLPTTPAPTQHASR